jgi:molybdopterin converting factor small subunit
MPILYNDIIKEISHEKKKKLKDKTIQLENNQITLKDAKTILKNGRNEYSKMENIFISKPQMSIIELKALIRKQKIEMERYTVTYNNKNYTLKELNELINEQSRINNIAVDTTDDNLKIII